MVALSLGRHFGNMRRRGKVFLIATLLTLGGGWSWWLSVVQTRKKAIL